jgi:hypothetical protein
MKQKKVVHRIPKEFHLVSQKNRVFADKKKEENVKACRKKVEVEAPKRKIGDWVWSFDTWQQKVFYGKIIKEQDDGDHGWHWGFRIELEDIFNVSSPDEWIFDSEIEAKKAFKKYLKEEIKEIEEEINEMKKILKD